MFRKFRKNISVITLLTFLFMNLQNFSYSSQMAFHPSILDVSNLNIPINMGEIVETFKGDKNQKVICIEDLHCDPNVQENIAEIIKTVKDTYKDKFKFIGVEGSKGAINVDILYCTHLRIV